MFRDGRLKRRAATLFYGWWVVLAATGVQILISGLFLQSFGVYVPILGDELLWSTTAISIAVVLRQVLVAVLGPIHGLLIVRFGARRVMQVGIIVLAIGFILFSQTTSLRQFYLVQLVMALGASFAGFLSVTSIVVKWFDRQRATALSLMQAGMSIGGLLAPFLAYLIGGFGWRAVSFGSAFVLLAGLPLLSLMLNAPEEKGLYPDGERGARAREIEAKQAGRQFTAQQALKTRAFWLLSLGHGSALVSVSAVIVHFVNHLSKGLDYSLQSAAAHFALVTSMTMLGQLSGGFLGDRFNKRLITSLAMLGHASAMLILGLSQHPSAVVLFSLLHGLSWGMRGPLMSAIRADYFGTQAFAAIMGFSSAIITIGAMLGPLLAGYSFDNLGSYQPSFLLFACISLGGSLCFWLAKKPHLP